jgi:hypothetical protein
MKSSFAFSFFVVMIALSCDPMRRINMKNETSGQAQIRWFIKEDSVNSSPLFISNSQEQAFVLEPVPGQDLIKMSFGIGRWSPGKVEDFVDDLDSIMISWSGKKLLLVEQDQMKSFLLSRRRGLDKSKIMILFRDENIASVE